MCFQYITCLSAPVVKLSPCVTLLLVTFSHHTQFFFTTSYLLSRHFANFPPRAPYLPTDFKFHDQVGKRRISPQLRPAASTSEASSEEDSFISISALRLDFHSILFFFLTPPADIFCKKPGRNINTIPRKDNFQPRFMDKQRLRILCSGFTLPDCRTSAGGTSLLCSPELQQLCSHLLAPVSFPEEWES